MQTLIYRFTPNQCILRKMDFTKLDSGLKLEHLNITIILQIQRFFISMIVAIVIFVQDNLINQYMLTLISLNQIFCRAINKFSTVMHNIRKMKKKRKNRLANPEELAQNKLLQISRQEYQDQNTNDADIFADKISPKVQQAASANRIVLTRLPTRNPHTFYNSKFQAQARSLSAYPSQELKNRSMQLLGKKPLNIINYILLGQAQKKEDKTHDQMIPSFQQDSLGFIRKKIGLKRQQNKINNFKESSFSWNIRKTQKQKNNSFQYIKNGIISPLQVRNIKIFSKYSFFP